MMFHGIMSYMEFTQFGSNHRAQVNSLLNLMNKQCDGFKKDYQRSRWEDMSAGIYRYLESELGIKINFAELHSKAARDSAQAAKLITALSSRIGTSPDLSLWRLIPQGRYSIVMGRYIQRVMDDSKGKIGHKAYALLALAEWINIGQRAFLINLVENDLTTRPGSETTDALSVYKMGRGPSITNTVQPRTLVMVDELKAIPMLTMKLTKMKVRAKSPKLILGGTAGIRGLDMESGVFLYDMTDAWISAYNEMVQAHPNLTINNVAGVGGAISKVLKTLRLFDKF